MESKTVVYGLLFLAVLPFVSAANCWGINEMPSGYWDWEAWLCNSTQQAGYYKSGAGVFPFSIMMHGQIETTAPYEDSTWRVYLVGFQYSYGYRVTLRCYKQMGTSGRYWWWYTGQQVTLVDGDWTPDGTPWILAGCPPVRNLNHQSGTPPKVQIGVAWDGFGRRSESGIKATTSALPSVRTRSRR